MKKILLFLAMLPSILFAQIGSIQTKEKPYELVVGNKLYRKVATDTYYLSIDSDNQFEEKSAILDLGVGASEAITSLGNLYALYDKGDSNFDLQGYRFGVRGGCIFVYHLGPLEYAAGDYNLRRNTLALIMYELLKTKNLPLGDVHVSFYDNTSIFIHYDTYGFRYAVSLHNISIPWSRSYAKGDIIVYTDLRHLINAAYKPNAYLSKTAKSGAYVTDKEQLIKTCEHILNK